MAHCVTGTCWNVTYQGVTVTVTAIDLATNGFVLSKDSVNALTCVDFSYPCSLLNSFVDVGPVATTKQSFLVRSMGPVFRSINRSAGFKI